MSSQHKHKQGHFTLRSHQGRERARDVPIRTDASRVATGAFSKIDRTQRAGVDGVPVYDEERRLNLINIHITIENMVSSTG